MCLSPADFAISPHFQSSNPCERSRKVCHTDYFIEILFFFPFFFLIKTHMMNIFNCRESVGGLYYLSYLDDNMLLGRAVGGGGVFVFTRAQSLY